MKTKNESIQELLSYWKHSERTDGDESSLSFRIIGLQDAQEIVLEKLEEEYPSPSQETQNTLALLRGAISDLKKIRRCLQQEILEDEKPEQS